MPRAFLLLVCLAAATAASAGDRAPETAAGEFIAVKDGRFVDAAGRQVLLHGINLAEKDPAKGYLGGQGPEDYARMRAWGFNCIRLCIFWDGVEPECGRYDDEYLARVDERIAWAKANGIRVMLDMHQDLWGRKVPGGNGAPAWATLDEGKPHATGTVWGDAYFLSQMVQASFDSFWANKPGPDGVGIQDRFALAWQHVAKRYADEPAVAGFDLMNEPSMGSSLLTVMLTAAPVLIDILSSSPDGPPAPSADALQQLAGKDMHGVMLDALSDLDAYRKLMDAIEPVFVRHEETQLHPMYQRVATAIREVDQRHIIFIEPHIGVNLGVRSELQPVAQADGAPDPLCAFAPHAYDLTTDTARVEDTSTERLDMIVDRASEHADETGLPMLLGEWGAFYGTSKALPAAKSMARKLAERRVSDTYWSFDNGIDKAPYFTMLSRPYAMDVAGILRECRLDPETGAFECLWQEDPGLAAPSRFFVPKAWYPNGFTATLVPEGAGHTLEPIPNGADNVYLVVTPAGNPGDRRLTISRKE